MQSLALVVHVLLAVVVIGLVLMQHGKGADAGAAFGSGASATVFGARGATSFLTRMTTVTAALFFSTSLLLFWIAAHRDSGVRSVTDSPALIEEAPAPGADGDLPGGVSELPAAPIGTGAEGAAGEGDLPAAPAANQDASPIATPAAEPAADSIATPDAAPGENPAVTGEPAPGTADDAATVEPAREASPPADEAAPANGAPAEN